MRNSDQGHDVLESLRLKDYVASPAVAYIMGVNAANKTGPGKNPFGVESLAKAWRKGFKETIEKMDYITRPLMLK